MTTNPFVGRWRIAEMSEWDREYLDIEVPAFIEFEPKGLGSFQFGTVVGFLDCRVVKRGDEFVIEWSWEGSSDSDPACGRGWATLANGELCGHLFIHLSDDSEFRAVRENAPARRSLPNTRRTKSGPA